MQTFQQLAYDISSIHDELLAKFVANCPEGRVVHSFKMSINEDNKTIWARCRYSTPEQAKYVDASRAYAYGTDDNERAAAKEYLDTHAFPHDEINP